MATKVHGYIAFYRGANGRRLVVDDYKNVLLFKSREEAMSVEGVIACMPLVRAIMPRKRKGTAE